jgi:hypothetical protein
VPEYRSYRQKHNRHKNRLKALTTAAFSIFLFVFAHFYFSLFYILDARLRSQALRFHNNNKISHQMPLLYGI